MTIADLLNAGPVLPVIVISDALQTAPLARALIDGVGMLRALAGPFPAAKFCPTGGITAATAPDYLALSNVPCVGGS